MTTALCIGIFVLGLLLGIIAGICISHVLTH